MSDLSSVERLKIEALFGMESGYVLSFSNNTFSMFTVENVGIDISDSKYEYGSSSKANRLRKFWLEESNEVVAKLLFALLDYWLAKKQTSGEVLSSKEKTLYDECQKIVSRLHQGSFNQTQENTSSQSQKERTFINGMDIAETKRPLKVFLCHAHSDKDAVKSLYTRLTQDGVDAWLDKAKLLPGQDWELEIRKAVREADVVVVCLSKQFNQAGFRQKEVRLALDTAMEKPEGEIFIIPARLEECDSLESLRKWHWVDLFEEDGYEMLMRAFRVRADKIGAEIKSEGLIESESFSTSTSTSISTTVVDGLNWATVSQSIIFYGRMSDAFPGLRGIKKFNGEEAVSRLNVLLRQPLSVNLSSSRMDGQVIPIWWLRGSADMYVSDFKCLGPDRILLDNLELWIDHIVAVREFGSENRNFVYVQAQPEKPTGLYQYSDKWLQNYLQDKLKNGHGYYFFEEYGLWKNNMVTREEYDDGAAIISGKPVQISGAELRLRYITAYNFVLCGGDHVLISDEPDVDAELTELLDGILLEQRTINDLVDFVDNLPNAKRYPA